MDGTQQDGRGPGLSTGLRCMAMGALGFSVMSVLVKLAGQRLPTTEIVLARGVVTLVLSIWALRHAGIPFWGNNRKLLVLRGLAGFGGLNCYYYAVTHLPLADATAIHYVNPFFTVLLAALLLGERIEARTVVFGALALAGVVLVARPSFVFGEGSIALDVTGVLAALGGAAFSAVAYVTVRRLGATDHPLVVVFYFPLVAVPATIPTVVTTAIWPVGLEWLILLGVGISTQLGQVFTTRGLHLEPAGRATAFTYMQVVFAGMFGMAFFGETPSALSIAGAALILAGTVGVARREKTTPAPPASG